MGKLSTPDRHVLETIILPSFASRPEVRRVLFVGCADYTKDYESCFVGREYYTIDVDPACAGYGAAVPGRHFIDSAENVDRYFRPCSLDLILMNGVFGYGLNRRERAETTVARCYDLLVDWGALMIGWNDDPDCKPFEPVGLAGLARFDRMGFPALTVAPGVRRLSDGDYLVDEDYRHVFSFFVKPALSRVKRGVKRGHSGYSRERSGHNP
jgi:hypothetical protein